MGIAKTSTRAGAQDVLLLRRRRQQMTTMAAAEARAAPSTRRTLDRLHIVRAGEDDDNT
jgi:hypothetical protein